MKNTNKKIQNAWAFYDWANSVYSLVITSSIFPIFYDSIFSFEKKDTVLFFGKSISYTALISFVTAIAFLIIACISPILSGIADYLGNKKKFLKFFCIIGSISCMLLYFFSIENIFSSVFIYSLGLIGFWGSIVFYNSYLPDIAAPKDQDRLSAKGFSMGYIGSVILLTICLFFIMSKSDAEAIQAMRFSFILTGVWWFLFSQYTFYYLPENRNPKAKLSKKVLLNGFLELKKVWNVLQEQLILKKYLKSFFVYSMAVQTVMLVATYFGKKEIIWENEAQSTTGLIISILLIQLIAILGATITSKTSKKIGNLKTLIGINCLWLLICILAYFVKTPVQFYITAAFVGLVMGGIQALSRSTYSKLLPKTKDTTSFFSFYDVTEKIGIVIGMFIFALIDQFSGSMRNAILFLGIFFAIGIFFLITTHNLEKNQ